MYVLDLGAYDTTLKSRFYFVYVCVCVFLFCFVLFYGFNVYTESYSTIIRLKQMLCQKSMTVQTIYRV